MRPINPTELISVDGLTQSFKSGTDTITPISNTNLSINKGSFNIIYGPSGSGKSTLLNALSGLQKPTAGSVTFHGRDIYKLKSNELARFRAQYLGMVYQDNYWLKSLSVLENVCMPLYFLGHSRRSAKQLGLSALDRVNMKQHTNKQPFVLSLGEQRRVALARALVNNPEYIIADEPTGNLDRISGDAVMDLLQKCKVDLGCTIILVTHNLEYLPMADRLFHIEDGNVVQVRSTDMQTATDELLRGIRRRIYKFRNVKNAK